MEMEMCDNLYNLSKKKKDSENIGCREVLTQNVSKSRDFFLVFDSTEVQDSWVKNSSRETQTKKEREGRIEKKEGKRKKKKGKERDKPSVIARTNGHD